MALVNTTHGPMDEALLIKKTGFTESDDDRTEWIEYWLEGEPEPVHRSVHITLKKMPPMFAEAARIGG